MGLEIELAVRHTAKIPGSLVDGTIPGDGQPTTVPASHRGLYWAEKLHFPLCKSSHPDQELIVKLLVVSCHSPSANVQSIYNISSVHDP